jgi:hypothetical protein
MAMKTRDDNSREAAESVAIQALTFLAADPEQLDRFLALTGLDRASIRAAAAQPGFLAGVLDHIASNESLTVAFAAYADLPPADVDRARNALSGPRWQRDDA